MNSPMICTGIAIDDCIADYILENRHLAGGTSDIYKLVVKRFQKTSENLCIEEVSPKDVLTYLARYRNSAATYNNNMAGLKSFFRWCRIKYGFCDPTERIFPIPQRSIPHVRVISMPEYKALAASRSVPCVIAVFLCNTGLRCREFVNLTHGDIDFRRKFIQVFGKGAKKRFIPLNNMAASSLCRHDILGVKRSCKWLRAQMVIASADAGVDRFNPHACRHFFATALLDRGVRIEQVSRLLGHASVDLTFKSYYHPESFGNVSVLDSL